jgi:hypothetical protein
MADSAVGRSSDARRGRLSATTAHGLSTRNLGHLAFLGDHLQISPAMGEQSWLLSVQRLCRFSAPLR